MSAKTKGTKLTKNIVFILLGTCLLGAGTSFFTIPSGLVTGGVTGFSIVVSRVLGTESVTSLVAVFSWSLFAVGFFVLGASFALKTLLSTIFYPLFVYLFSSLASPDVLGGFFVLSGPDNSQVALLLAAIFGGALIGSGCALTFLGGGSTGGTDIIAFGICRFFKRAKSTRVIFVIDGAIILMGLFAFGDLTLSLLGITAAFVSMLVLDKIFLGASSSFVAQIISDKPKEINMGVIEHLHRTTTIVDAFGGYTGTQKKMIIASFKIDQYATLLSLVNSADPDAFVTIYRAHEINGRGWTQ